MDINRFGLHLLPKRTLTSVVGVVSRHAISRHLIPWYVRHYQIDLSEAELSLNQYRTLAEFFARKLKQDARPINQTGVVSPVDGTVSEHGPVVDGQLLQAKGCVYTLAALLGSTEAAERFHRGHYVTLYLSPRDYHRIHMPVKGHIHSWCYIPGTLYPVNTVGVGSIAGLFTKNERLVSYASTAHGQMAVVKVGAAIVGSIRTPYGPTYAGPWSRKRRGFCSATAHAEYERGEEIGLFEFGSTVILVFERGFIQEFLVETGQPVRMGQVIAQTVE